MNLAERTERSVPTTGEGAQPFSEDLSTNAARSFRGSVKSLKDYLDVSLTFVDKAKHILSDRYTLLEQVAPHFIRVAEAVGSVYSDNFSDQIQGRRREGASTRYIYAGLLSMLPEQARTIWLDLPRDLRTERLQLLKVFGWSFNRMLTFRGNPELDKHVDIKPRGSLAGQTLPYPMHTHIDVPFCIKSLGLTQSMQSLALAAAHDALEEGLCFAVDAGSIAHGQVDLSGLAQKFPQHNLGRNLILGVPALTESSFSEIADAIDGKLLATYREECTSTLQQSALTNVSDKASRKYLFENPLVFGGLALQLREVVIRLAQSSSPQNLELAKDLIKVEMGDRISDMAALERLVSSTVTNPDEKRLRIGAYAFRMLNMLAKLQEAVSVLGEAVRSEFAHAFALYPAVLRVKIDEVNVALAEQGIAPISTEELAHMCERIFYPIQDAADQVLQAFIGYKVDGIIINSGLYAKYT